MGTRRAGTRLAAALVLVAADAVFLVAVLLPWAAESRSNVGPGDPLGDLVIRTAELVGLGPVLTSLLLRRLWRGAPAARGRDRPVLIAGLGGALAAAVLAGWALGSIDVERGLRPAGTVAVAAASVAVLAWAALAWLPPGPLRPARARVAGLGSALAVGLVAALVLVTVPVVRWHTTGRFLRHSAAAALPAVPDDPPARLDQFRWQARIEATEKVPPMLTGRYLLVPERLGVRALDAVTGSQHWGYLRSDATRLIAAASTSDGRTSLLLYQGQLQVLGIALDTATGAVRWERRFPPDTLPTYGPEIAATASLFVVTDVGRVNWPIIGLSATDGTLVWTTHPDGRCNGYSPPVIAGTVAAYVEHCPSRPDHVVALSTVDGRRLWTWSATPGTGTGPYAGMFGAGALRATPAGLLASYDLPSARDSRRDVALLDPATGAVRGTYTAPGDWHDTSDHIPTMLAVPAGDTVVYLGPTAAAVDVRTGRARWSRALPELSGWRPIQAVVRGDLTYALLLAGPGRDAAAPPLRLIAVHTDTGVLRVDMPFQPRRCGADCGPTAETLLLAGPGVLVVDEAAGPRDDEVCFLSAIG